MSERKYFGTDGIRGRVGDAPITPDFVLKLGWAAGKVLARHGSRKIIIGKDTRISGYMLESALEAGLAAAGLSASFTGPMPTPAVAYLTRTFRAEAGIVISASHNPFYDNGIKFFSIEGTKLPDDVEEAIEAEMEKEITCVDSAELGKANRIVDAAGRYIEFCKGTFPNELSLSHLKIVVDCANGATYHIAPNVFRELGAKVITIGCEPDGVNINEGVGATDVRALQARVLAEKADLGIALDGDGDRVIMVDHEGNKVDGDQILYIIAREGLRQGQLRGGAVGTLMSNMGLELALKQLGIPFVRAKVGDRYVLEKLQEKGWRIGAENSGLGDRQALCFVAQTIGIEVFCHRSGIERGAVREGNARADPEGVFGFIGVAGPAFSDPRLDVQRFWVLPGELVGHLIENATIWVKPARRGIEIGMRLLFQIDKRTAFNRSISSVGGGCRDDQRREQRQAKRDLHGEFLVIFCFSVGFIIGCGQNERNKGKKLSIAGMWQ
jgi:phosphoglucosamine mutase